MSGSPSLNSHALSVRRLWLADLALLFVAFIWGVNIPVMKVALEYGITPYALNAVRLVISAVVLLLCAWWEYRGGIRPAPGLSLWRIVVYALVVSVAYQFLFLLAVSKTTSANIALIMATVPMWTALGARAFLKEILPPLAWIGLFTAFAGTMIVTVQSDDRSKLVEPLSSVNVSRNADTVLAPSVSEPPAALALTPSTVSLKGDVATTGDEPSEQPAKAQPSSTFYGNMIALIASFTWAGGTVFSRPLLKTMSPVQLAACSATIGLPFHMLIAAPTLALAVPLLSQTPLLLCVIYSGILSTGLALALWSYGVKHAGAAQATMFQNLSPIIAIGAAWLWRGETVSWAQTLGGVLIIGGLIIMRQSRMAVLAAFAASTASTAIIENAQPGENG